MWHRNMKQKREFLCHLVYSMLYQFFSILFPTSNTRWSGTTELWIDSRQSSPLMYAPLSLTHFISILLSLCVCVWAWVSSLHRLVMSWCQWTGSLYRASPTSTQWTPSGGHSATRPKTPCSSWWRSPRDPWTKQPSQPHQQSLITHPEVSLVRIDRG